MDGILKNKSEKSYVLATARNPGEDDKMSGEEV
jgi:hypothetical protein